MELSPKAIREDEVSDITNDSAFLEALRGELAKAMSESRT